MESLDEEHMRLALGEAALALEEDEVPAGAAILRGRELLALAHNRVRATGNPTAHGEMLAIAAAAERVGDWRLCGCTLYCTKEPCPMCAGACVMARLDRVVYGIADPAMGCLGGGPCDLSRMAHFNHRFPVQGGILAEDCLALLRNFFLPKRGKRQG
ncbi:MAG: nucleoside deaminase [Puniceicoccales bacterium]|jgi:tRNA(adenine34) deaminase|nr:nucleoside deaminase [Puniceicoccales bacterium]